MIAVDGAFGHYLWMNPDPSGQLLFVGSDGTEVPTAGRPAEHHPGIGHRPQRGSARHVMPEVNAFVPLGDRPGTDPAAAVGLRLVWNPNVAAVAVPYPAVERTLNAALHYAAAVGQIGAEMLTMRVEHMHRIVEIAEHHQVGAEVMQRLDVADLEVGAPGTWNQPVVAC